MDDDFQDGKYLGSYRYYRGYHRWAALRETITTALKLDVDKIWFFLLAGHIGDQVSGLSLVGAFKQLRDNPTIAIITDGPPDLGVLFGHCADIFATPNSFDLLSDVLPLQRFAPGYPFIVEPHCHGDGRLLDLFPVCTFNDLMRYTLRLPMDVAPVPPRVPETVRAHAEQLFASYGLAPGRTVLLAPYSNSAPRMPVAWWTDAAEDLKRRGLIPVTNVPNHYGKVKREEPIPGTIAVDVPLVQVIPFVEMAGHFLATAQGLCDLVSFARAKLKIIQTPAYFLDRTAPTVGGSATGGYSLKRNFAPLDCDERDLNTAAPFDPVVLDGWGG